MKKIATIIVTYNGVQWIEHCIKNLIASSFRSTIIVVDNNSTDKTVELLLPFADNITLLQMEENLGFGAANNIAIKKALELGVDFFFLLNQDAYVSQRCIENLLTAAIKFPEYGILSPMQLNGEGNRLDVTFENQISRTIKPIPKVEFEDSEAFKSDLKPAEVRFVGAAAWLLPKKAIEEVGLFHPVFYHYGEDNNYAARLQYHGYKIGVLKESKVIHDRVQRKDIEKFLPTKLRTFPLHLLMDIRKPLFIAWFIGLYQLLRIRKKLHSIAYNKYEVQYLETRKWFFENLTQAITIRRSLKVKNSHIKS